MLEFTALKDPLWPVLGGQWIIWGVGAAGAETGWSGCYGGLDERVVTGRVDKSHLT